MVEELKGYKNDSVYYMAAHCNGSGKFMVKTTCEKLPQLETAKPVSISYNKIKCPKRKSKRENKPASTNNGNENIHTQQQNTENATPSTVQITSNCNGHNNRLSALDDTTCPTQSIDSTTLDVTGHKKYQQLSGVYSSSNAANISDIENNRPSSKKCMIQPNYSRISDSSALSEKITKSTNAIDIDNDHKYDDHCHAKKQMLCPSFSSHALTGKLSYNGTNDSRNISSSSNCIISKSTTNGKIENSNSMTTLVLPIASPEVTSTSICNQINNPIETKSEYKENAELLTRFNSTLTIPKITKLLKRKTMESPQPTEIQEEADASDSRSFNSVVKPFQTYCKQTSLHGWKYVAFSKGSRFERLCWLFLLLLALLIASNLVYRAVDDFINQTVSTNMDSMSMSFDNLYFPAITICNMNFMQRSVLEKYGLQNNTLMDVFDRMVNTGSQYNFTEEEQNMFEFITKKSNRTSQDLKLEGHPECHSMFLEYHWKNKEIPLYYMHYAQTTDASLCCQIFPGMLPSENNASIDIFNGSFWSQKNEFGRPNVWQVMFDGYKTGIFPGKQGINVLIDVESYEYFSSHSTGSEGVLVLIQHYRDIPLMRKESFVLSPGFEVDVGLGVTQIVTTEPAISRFGPQQRHCYTHDEVNLTALPLEKGYRMSMKNCLYDKALHATIEECNCLPSFYTLGAIGNDKKRCIGKDLDCAYRVFDDVESPQRNHVGTAQGKCQQPCNDQIYNSRITFARFPNRAMFGRRSKGTEVCKLSRKLLRICHGWVDEEAKGQCSFCHGDEFKIRKNVLEREYPDICESLIAVLGGNTTNPISYEVEECSNMRKAFLYTDAGKRALDVLYTYAKKNLLWLNVYVKDSFATKIVRDEKVTITSFVANVGGLLGLCMGFSLVSVVEMVYFCIKEKLFGIIDAICGTSISTPKIKEDNNRIVNSHSEMNTEVNSKHCNLTENHIK